ncbi:hypothetical protein NZK35_09780 [Stieleria sp. ICT_E10.1]|uniref:hypothetical protein n=1 Tax=Stieleria sedimenti TaxID=2976331 RepID=UPI0021804620|nr:hypothetical protein [Stieleria sedimenti]MCS7466934.1 hypothetical protein [Stieleria sedimenti]
MQKRFVLLYRVYLGTGDARYAETARFLLHSTRRHVDIDGSLGYGQPGLCTGALNLSIDHVRRHGVDVWLRWLSYQMIKPIVRLQETYGISDTPVLGERAFQAMQVKDSGFAHRRGFGLTEVK